MGRINLHNHILFDLDDGAVDAAESLELARALVAAGYTDVATTPHAKPDMDPDDDTVSERRISLQALLDKDGIALRLHPGRENHLTPGYMERIASGGMRPLGNGPYALVELPFATPVPGLRELLFQMMLKGVRPLLAHPERCAQFTDRPAAAREAFDAGAAFQIEVGSVGNLYGPQARRCAEALLDEGMVAVAATDAHHLRSTQQILTAGLRSLGKAVGPKRLALLTEENPGRVLRGEPLLPV